MLHLIRNALREPQLIPHAMSWLVQKHVLRRDPSRKYYRASISNFSDFSEFYSFARAIDEGEFSYLSGLEIGDGLILDVGANLGAFSINCSHLHPQASILAFEPARTTFNALTKNIALNDSRARLLRLAVSETDGEVQFAINEKSRATASISASGETVQAKCLDTIAAQEQIDRIALLKIDVEGYEALVLRGAKNLLAQGKIEQVYFEICPALSKRAGFDPAEPGEILETHGYKLFEIGDGGKLKPVNAKDARTRSLTNWVAQKGD